MISAVPRNRRTAGAMSEDGSVARSHFPRRQLSDEVASYVRELIVSGRLRSGQFVRQEQIAEELDLSATPVREGLLALMGEGFVELKPRRGFVVAPLSAADVRDLFTAQELLAGELVYRAAGRIDNDGLRALRQVHEENRRAVAAGDSRAIEDLNHDFHQRIFLIAGAPRLEWMLSIATRFTPTRFLTTNPKWNRASTRDHAEILRALGDHDGERARAAMMRHMENAGELVATHFEAAQGGASAGAGAVSERRRAHA
jgi:DNA-binding GntR family transcriptional regulator